MKTNEENISKIIFAIEKHDLFDYIIVPYLITVLNKGYFSCDNKRINKSLLSQFDLEASPEEIAILEVLDECRHEYLLHQFGSGYRKFNEFYESLPKKKLQKVLKYMRDRHDSAIALMAQSKIPIYYKGDRNALINEDPIRISHEKMTVSFHFQRDDQGISYRIEVRQSDHEIDLCKGHNLILLYQPCWLLRDQCLYQIADDVDGKKLEPFFTKNEIRIGKENEAAYLRKFVKSIAEQYDVHCTGSIILQKINVEPEVTLSIQNSLFDSVFVTLTFDYDKERIDYHNERKTFVRIEEKQGQVFVRKTERDSQFEKEIYRWLCSIGFEPYISTGLQLINERNDELSEQEKLYELINFFNENLAIFKEKNIYIDHSYLKHNYFTGEIRVKQEITSGIDWFDIFITVEFDDIVIPFASLRKNILENRREFVLPDGRIVLLPKEWFSRYHDIAFLAKDNGAFVRCSKNQFAYLQNIIDPGSRISDVIQELSTPSYPNIEIPGGMKKTLRSYQKTGVNWMQFLFSHGFGGCLSDDMGLGKTFQMLAFLWYQKNNKSVHQVIDVPKNEEVSIEEEGIDFKGQLSLFSSMGEKNKHKQPEAALIVMPLSLIYNWENEILNTIPEMTYYIYHGTGRKISQCDVDNHDIVLTTYGTMRNDIDKLKKFNFRFVILDESQNIKNPYSKVFRAAIQLQCPSRFTITGTPIENSITDLWAQMTFINPGLLGDLNYFRTRFLMPIEKQGRKATEKQFKNIIQPFILKRTKEEVAPELPTMTEVTYFCEMTPEQAKYYEERKSAIRNHIFELKMSVGFEKSYMAILSGMMKLRLIANHPKISDKDYAEDSGKFIQVVETIRKIIATGHKVLIFSQFVRHLHLFQNFLDDENMDYLLLTGSTKPLDRAVMIERFQTDESIRIFLMSIKAGGVGLNLTAADFVFILDPWWNPSVEMQAINRTHRIGQDKKVLSYKFITKGSIEEKIILLQQKKQKLSEIVSSNFAQARFTEEEVHELLG